MYPRFVFWAKVEKYHNFSSENYLFTAVKNCSILHGHVIVVMILWVFIRVLIQGNSI